MVERFYQKKKSEWKRRARLIFAMDIAGLFNGSNTLILQAPPFFAGSSTAPTTSMRPVVADISECPTLVLPAITMKLPRTPSGNLM